MGLLGDRRREKSQEQLDRELRMPEDNYDFHHRQQYGSARIWPKDSREDGAYKTYKAYNDEYKRVLPDYNTELKKVTKDYENRVASNQQMGEYYSTTSAGLLPEHHGRMLPEATGLDDMAYYHAKERSKFLEDFPYAYNSLEDRKEHVHHIRRAHKAHRTAQEYYNTHNRYAPDPNSTARDLYGNEVPAGWAPSPYAYPPDPPEGHYSPRLSQESDLRTFKPFSMKKIEPRGGRRSPPRSGGFY